MGRAWAPDGAGIVRAPRGKDWGSLFRVAKIETLPHAAKIICRDDRPDWAAEYSVELDPESGVLCLSTLTNYGAAT